jgi:hypothetical protein
MVRVEKDLSSPQEEGLLGDVKRLAMFCEPPQTSTATERTSQQKTSSSNNAAVYLIVGTLVLLKIVGSYFLVKRYKNRFRKWIDSHFASKSIEVHSFNEAVDKVRAMLDYYPLQLDPIFLVFGPAGPLLTQLREASEEIRNQPLYMQHYLADSFQTFLETWYPGPRGTVSFAVVENFLRTLPDLHFLKGRARNLGRARIDEEWKQLPPIVKIEAGYEADSLPPDILYEEADKIPTDEDAVSISPIDRFESGWQNDPQYIENTYGDTPSEVIREVNAFLTFQNPELNFYPDLLHLKATTLIRDWNELHPKKQKLIRDLQEQADRMLDRMLLGGTSGIKRTSIPEIFLQVWYGKSVPKGRGPKDTGTGSSSHSGDVVDGFERVGDDPASSASKPSVRKSLSSSRKQMIAGLGVFWGRSAVVAVPVRTQMVFKPVFAK